MKLNLVIYARDYEALLRLLKQTIDDIEFEEDIVRRSNYSSKAKKGFGSYEVAIIDSEYYSED